MEASGVNPPCASSLLCAALMSSSKSGMYGCMAVLTTMLALLKVAVGCG